MKRKTRCIYILSVIFALISYFPILHHSLSMLWSKFKSIDILAIRTRYSAWKSLSFVTDRDSFFKSTWKFHTMKKELYVACHRHRNDHRIRGDIHMHTYIHTYIHIQTHVCIRIIHIYIHTCLYIYIRMHLCIYKVKSIIPPASVLRCITYIYIFFCYINNTPISIENQTQFKKLNSCWGAISR